MSHKGYRAERREMRARVTRNTLGELEIYDGTARTELSNTVEVAMVL